MPRVLSAGSCVGFTGHLFSLCPQDLASKLKEAEETQSTLQAECDQYRTILAETVSSQGRASGTVCWVT